MTPPAPVDSDWIIGVDEAGRGPVIGPLVVAALAIPSNDIEKLTKLQVKIQRNFHTMNVFGFSRKSIAT